MQRKINLKDLRGCVFSFGYIFKCYGCGFYYLLNEMKIKCNCVLMLQILLFDVFVNLFTFYLKNDAHLPSTMTIHQDRKRQAS